MCIGQDPNKLQLLLIGRCVVTAWLCCLLPYALSSAQGSVAICPSKQEHRVEALAATECSTVLVQCVKKCREEDTGTWAREMRREEYVGFFYDVGWVTEGCKG